MSPPGLTRSPLTVLNSRESYITVTWTPSASQQGTANIFCYTATDNFGCVESKKVGKFGKLHSTSFYMCTALTLSILIQIMGCCINYTAWLLGAQSMYVHASLAIFSRSTFYAFVLIIPPIRLTSPQVCITLVVGGM